MKEFNKKCCCQYCSFGQMGGIDKEHKPCCGHNVDYSKSKKENKTMRKH